TETSWTAFWQSSRESRSPTTNLTLPAAECLSRVRWRFSSLLECLTKHQMLVKPYSRRQSTTLAPIKPLAPVTRKHSSESAIYLELIVCAKMEVTQKSFRKPIFGPSRFGLVQKPSLLQHGLAQPIGGRQPIDAAGNPGR